MGGRGPAPKPSALRQRRNKPTTAATLPSEEESAANEVPALVDRDDGADWHPMVLEWWDSVWKSPMAAEFLDVDRRGGLYLIADLYQARWLATSASAIATISKEIRLQEARFGLSPIDRRRLQWEVARGEEAERKTVRKPRTPEAPRKGDPRDVLRLA